jgi:hypothetical protein
MPANKNQHFVPRCLLKPFTLHGAGLAINLFNIPRATSVQNAPVKSQCARNYLYGKDNRTESLLARLEGQYARVVSHLGEEGNVTEADEEWLRLFVAIQQRRTASAIEDMRNLMGAIADKVFARTPENRPDDNHTDAEMMDMSLALALEFVKMQSDLKLVPLVNQTKTDFVVSDHPAVLTNRFHFQRLNQDTFGVANSGAIISLPLNPRLSLIAYDPQVYTIPNATGRRFVDLTRDEDVLALNQLQYVSADKNIYFRSWSDAERIGSEVAALAEIRAASGVGANLLVRDYAAPGPGEVYRRGSEDEETTAKEAIVTTSRKQPKPPHWPSVMKIRSKPITFFDRSAVGHVRKREWLYTREY